MRDQSLNRAAYTVLVLKPRDYVICRPIKSMDQIKTILNRQPRRRSRRTVVFGGQPNHDDDRTVYSSPGFDSTHALWLTCFFLLSYRISKHHALADTFLPSMSSMSLSSHYISCLPEVNSHRSISIFCIVNRLRLCYNHH